MFIECAFLVSNELSAADVQALTSLYRTRSCAASAHHAARYFLQGIPALIQATAFDHEASSEDMRHLIHEHYFREDDCYLLVSKYISELDELKIVKAFAPQQPHLAESKRIEGRYPRSDSRPPGGCGGTKTSLDVNTVALRALSGAPKCWQPKSRP